MKHCGAPRMAPGVYGSNDERIAPVHSKGHARTIVALFIGAVMTVLLMVMGLSKRPPFPKWRPAIWTMLIGTVAICAFMIAYTVEVEAGAAKLQGSGVGTSGNLRGTLLTCPPYTRRGATDGSCVPYEEKTLTIDDDKHALAVDAYGDFDLRIDKKEANRILQASESPSSDQEWLNNACCAANKVPYTALNIQCPISEHLKCLASQPTHEGPAAEQKQEPSKGSVSWIGNFPQPGSVRQPDWWPYNKAADSQLTSRRRLT